MVSFSYAGHIEASVFNSVSFITNKTFFEVRLIVFNLKAAVSDILFFIKMSV